MQSRHASGLEEKGPSHEANGPKPGFAPGREVGLRAAEDFTQHPFAASSWLEGRPLGLDRGQAAAREESRAIQ